MHDTSSPVTESNLAALWAPRTLAEDSAVRLALVIGLVALVLACRPLWLVVPLVAILLALACRRGSAAQLAAMVLVGAAFALGLNALTEPGRALWQWGPLQVTEEGLRVGAERALRLAGLVAIGRLAIVWIDAWALAELADRSASDGASGGTIRRWAFHLALTLGLALRLLPVVRDEATRLQLATRTRPGRDFRGGVGMLRQLAPLFLPLLAGTVRRAEEVARTLDARCFATGPRSSRLDPTPTAPRLTALVLMAGALALFLLPGRI